MKLEMEIEEMVASIAKHKEEERTRLETTSFKSLKDSVCNQTNLQKRKSYVPKRKTQDELLGEIKIKKSWKTGSHSGELSKVPIIRGAVLNEWQAARTIMPERNYKIPKGMP